MRWDESSRDSAVLRLTDGDGQPAGEATFSLIAAVYFNGGHYITVGRGSQHGILGSAQWVCWDGMENHGYGVVLSEAPTGSNRLQSRATDASGAPSISWTSSYVPTMALYHRHSP